jgi:hypothetical protein
MKKTEPLGLKWLFQNLLRFAAIAVGAGLVTLLPIDHHVQARRAANAAAGHLPNMDPGVVIVIALFVLMPIMLALFLFEIARCRVKGQTPLAYLSSLALGAAAAWPVGLAFSVPQVGLGKAGVWLCAALSVAAFHGARWLWLSGRRGRAVSR